ncbi:hypothetical protein BLN97_14210 [Bradyrhizobium elkanii]|nr:hypothetical protein BLN97_14210 [Bradyrhizobium elkanii]
MLIEANEATVEQRGKMNAIEAVVASLHSRYPSNQIVAATFRLQALASLMSKDDLKGLQLRLHGKDHALINEAAFHAAAKCRLVMPPEDATSRDALAFDKDEFIRLAMQYAEPDGSA